MNPEYIAAGFVHTIPERLSEYFLEPLTNIFIILILIIMFANTYMLRKLWKIKTKDYMTIINIVTVGIYSVMAIISSVLVSRLGPHGKVALDDCDKAYMSIPRLLFIVVAIINIIYFIVNICTKAKKNKEYKETLERGYYAEDTTNDDYEKTEKKSSEHKNIMDSVSSLAEEIKEKVDFDGIKDKVSQVTEDVKELINKKNDKE